MDSPAYKLRGNRIITKKFNHQQLQLLVVSSASTLTTTSTTSSSTSSSNNGYYSTTSTTLSFSSSTSSSSSSSTSVTSSFITTSSEVEQEGLETYDENDLSFNECNDFETDYSGNKSITRLTITKTIRGKPKLCYKGFYYTIDRHGQKESIQWKCERPCNTQAHAKCSGRVLSYGSVEPVQIITDHNHIPEPEREDGLLALNEILREHIYKTTIQEPL